MSKNRLRGVQISSLPTSFYSNGSTSSKESIIIRGWGFATGAGSVIDQTVTFPMTFATPPTAIATVLGAKGGSDPGAMTDAGLSAEVVRGGQLTSTTDTHLYITGTNGGSVGSGIRVLYNLIIIGEPA